MLKEYSLASAQSLLFKMAYQECQPAHNVTEQSLHFFRTEQVNGEPIDVARTILRCLPSGRAHG